MRAGALALALLAASCAWMPADEQVLVEFFERSKRYDKTMLAEVATTVFNPGVDGVVERFDVVGRQDESSGGIVRQTVTVRAAVRSPGGTLSSRDLAVTMEQRKRAWVVTGFRPLS